jgi:hypothetical protein
MAILGFAPWAVLIAALVVSGKPAQTMILASVAFPAAVVATNIWIPMAAKEDAYQRRIESDYRPIRLAGGIVMCVIVPLALWQWPGLDVRPSQVALIGSLIGLSAVAHHVRFRWIKPGQETAA